MYVDRQQSSQEVALLQQKKEYEQEIATLR